MDDCSSLPLSSLQNPKGRIRGAITRLILRARLYSNAGGIEERFTSRLRAMAGEALFVGCKNAWDLSAQEDDEKRGRSPVVVVVVESANESACSCARHGPRLHGTRRGRMTGGLIYYTWCSSTAHFHIQRIDSRLLSIFSLHRFRPWSPLLDLLLPRFCMEQLKWSVIFVTVFLQLGHQ